MNGIVWWLFVYIRKRIKPQRRPYLLLFCIPGDLFPQTVSQDKLFVSFFVCGYIRFEAYRLFVGRNGIDVEVVLFKESGQDKLIQGSLLLYFADDIVK